MNEAYRRSGIISPRCFQSQQILKRLPTMQLDHVFGPHATIALALSNKGRSLAAASILGEMFIYNNKNWEYFSKINFHQKFAEALIDNKNPIPRNYKFIARYSTDIKEFSEQQRFAIPTNIHMMQYYPHGEKIIFTSSKQGFQVHDSVQGHLETLVKNSVDSHDISPNSLQAAVVNSAGLHSVTIVDISRGANLHRINIETDKMRRRSRLIVKWSPLDASILVCTKNDSIQFWDVRCASQTPVAENKQVLFIKRFPKYKDTQSCNKYKKINFKRH